MRKDLYQSRLGTRIETGYKRLWLEDTAQRLTRNGFESGTVFVSEPRIGPGLNIRPAILGDYTVSSRRGVPVCSLENNSVAAALPVDDVLIRISVGLISVLPSVRAFSVRTASAESWEVTNDAVITPRERVSLATGLARPSGRPSVVTATITDDNLITATEFLAWAKPGEIRLNAEGLADLTARRFLASCGWEEGADLILRR